MEPNESVASHDIDELVRTAREYIADSRLQEHSDCASPAVEESNNAVALRDAVHNVNVALQQLRQVELSVEGLDARQMIEAGVKRLEELVAAPLSPQREASEEMTAVKSVEACLRKRRRLRIWGKAACTSAPRVASAETMHLFSLPEVMHKGLDRLDGIRPEKFMTLNEFDAQCTAQQVGATSSSNALERAVEQPAMTTRTDDQDVASIEALRAALCEQFGLSLEVFAPEFDYVYSGSSASSGRRGEEPYIRPSSDWQKLGLHVLDKYDDREWLRRSTWPIVYHGTSACRDIVCGILSDGFRIRGGRDRAQHGERLGVGIYCSPVLEKAVQYAEEPLIVGGVPYTLVFQCRVRPSKYAKPEKHVWLVTNEADIRPCGILLRRSLLRDSLEIRYSQKNPHRPYVACTEWEFYDTKLRHVRTVKEARTLGKSLGNLHKDLLKGRLKLVGSDCKSIQRRYSKWKHEMAAKLAGGVRHALHRGRRCDVSCIAGSSLEAGSLDERFLAAKDLMRVISNEQNVHKRHKRDKKAKKDKKDKKEKKDKKHDKYLKEGKHAKPGTFVHKDERQDIKVGSDTIEVGAQLGEESVAQQAQSSCATKTVYVPMKEHNIQALNPVGCGEHVVDNSQLVGPTRGVDYRCSKNTADVFPFGENTWWESTVHGDDDGEGWLPTQAVAQSSFAVPQMFEGVSGWPAANRIDEPIAKWQSIAQQQHLASAEDDGTRNLSYWLPV